MAWKTHFVFLIWSLEHMKNLLYDYFMLSCSDQCISLECKTPNTNRVGTGPQIITSCQVFATSFKAILNSQPSWIQSHLHRVYHKNGFKVVTVCLPQLFQIRLFFYPYFWFSSKTKGVVKVYITKDSPNPKFTERFYSHMVF